MNKNTLKKLAHTRSQAGQGFSEYSLIIVLVVVAVSVLIRIFGERLANLVNSAMSIFQ
ncbi:MAG: hypothetical protein K8R40_02670 [Anaerolineaceae bacterium]|nr:hypothetical protein [Anaerolineaceae bacterium]